MCRSCTISGRGCSSSPTRWVSPASRGRTTRSGAGTDLVAFSGDKLLGGPQAGILLGRADLIARLRDDPLCRALRVDKVTLAGLEATLRLYREPAEALAEIPTLRMLVAEPQDLEARAERVSSALTAAGVNGRVVETAGAVGGGTFPGVELPSRAVEPARRQRREVGRGPESGESSHHRRVVDDALLLDIRTVLADQEDELVARVIEVATEDRRTASRPDGPTAGVFVDRDGTLIVERSYLADPAGVVLVPGVVTALADLRRAGFALVTVTNQSGLARGLYTEQEYHAVAARLNEVLADGGVHVDRTEYCAHHPGRVRPVCMPEAWNGHAPHRGDRPRDRPGAVVLRGGKATDVLPAVELGGQGILVRTGYGREHEASLPAGTWVADDLRGAADLILRDQSR